MLEQNYLLEKLMDLIGVDATIEALKALIEAIEELDHDS